MTLYIRVFFPPPQSPAYCGGVGVIYPQPLDMSGEPLFDLVVGEKNRRGNVPLVAIVAPDAHEAGVLKKYM